MAFLLRLSLASEHLGSEMTLNGTEDIRIAAALLEMGIETTACFACIVVCCGQI